MSETKPSQTITKKMVSRNVAIALGIICIILVVGLVGAFAYYILTMNDKNNTISSLNTQISQLTTNNTNFQSWLDGNITAYDNYVSDHSYTDEQYQNLLSQITSVQNQLYGLLSQIESKNAQITSLQNQITSDASTINSLTSQNSNLQSQYTTLQANYSQLMQDYQVALTKIPPDKGIGIDSVNWSRTGIINAGVTDVVVRNLGVNDTTVISLKLFWTSGGGILASSVSEDITISGNSTSDIKTFLPISGWNSYYDTWTLKVYTLEGYTATSDPLPLVM